MNLMKRQSTTETQAPLGDIVVLYAQKEIPVSRTFVGFTTKALLNTLAAASTVDKENVVGVNMDRAPANFGTTIEATTREIEFVSKTHAPG